MGKNVERRVERGRMIVGLNGKGGRVVLDWRCSSLSTTGDDGHGDTRSTNDTRSSSSCVMALGTDSYTFNPHAASTSKPRTTTSSISTLL